ncbi:MAG: flavin reductase family protein [Terricaulis sp.]|nr:flavin reductase family protein [Terricaulis sp.]
MALRQEETPTNAIAAELRKGLRSLAKAVVVITTSKGGQRFAMTATAVSELSMDPPSMLICVNKSASMHPALADGADFCINILKGEQGDIAACCSGKASGDARFSEGEWLKSSLGAPYLADAQAAFVCRQASHATYGTHSVFIGEVVEAHTSTPYDPLVYIDGRYTRVQPA